MKLPHPNLPIDRFQSARHSLRAREFSRRLLNALQSPTLRVPIDGDRRDVRCLVPSPRTSRTNSGEI
ncbi:hypothetical protein GALMADRAFT_795188 [Galerina marginata CBS 339.88]|uniref:Uncharacterized protein n=1 Tax=Galerina marginata (strain CBS 339.88) TaxID=685588 RepID=A0A067SY08_GALM3|nr:hypothetical protein GALMADRAFT_795188 [Galerina marginata CBS 339.88]